MREPTAHEESRSEAAAVVVAAEAAEEVAADVAMGAEPEFPF